MATFPMGGGHGLLSCPAGSGLLPGLYSKPVALVAAAKGGGGGAVGVPAALGAPGHGIVGASKSVAAKGVVAGGTACKGLSLGLGIGLGAWGPMVLVGLGVAAAYGLWRSRSAVEALSHEDKVELGDAAILRR